MRSWFLLDGTEPCRYGLFGLQPDKAYDENHTQDHATIGPTTRPRLTKELLKPMDVPCPAVVRFDVSE